MSDDVSSITPLRREFSYASSLSRRACSTLMSHAAVIFLPAVIGVVAYPYLLADDLGGSSPVKQYFCFTELVDDLFWCKSLLDHLSPFYEIITGIVLGGQVRARDLL